MTNTSSLRRSLGLVVLVLTFLSLAVPNAMATHLRGGSISWTPIAGAPNGSHRIQFTVQHSQRWSFQGSYGANPPLNKVGTMTGFGGTLNFYVNKGTVTLDPTGTVTSINSTEDWMTVSFTFTYDYVGCVTDTTYLLGSNRLSTLEIGHDASEKEIAVVNSCAINGSPVASVPAVLAVPLLPTTGFDFSAGVTDIDPSVHLAYRLATVSEMFDTSSVPCLGGGSTTSQAPPGFSINSTGQVTWDTTKIAGGVGCVFAAPKAGDLWSVQIIVEARDANNVLVSSVPVDLMMKFVTPVGALPTMTVNPVGPQTVTPGTPVSFTATGNSTNPGAKITLNANGVPVGATATKLNQTLTPPVVSDFSWTPAIGQTGTFVITYTATDNNFQQASASETIIVVAAPPTATCSNAISVPYGQSGTVSADLYDPNNELLNVVFALDGNTVQTYSNVVAYPNAATESITQTYGAAGPHSVKVKATDPHGVAGNCSTPVTVTKADQTITFDPLNDVTYGAPDFNLIATASSTLTVEFTASGSCTVAGNTVHITTAGPCTITAMQPGDNNYNAAPPVMQILHVAQQAQAITFTTSAPANAAYQSSFTVAATGGGSNNPVTFTSAGACSNAGATYTMTSGTGTCSVIANQAGDANYTAAPQVTQTVGATQLAQAITFSINAPASAAYQTSFTVAATGGASGNPVTFTSSGVCSNAGATYTMTSGTGSCSVIANQAGDANYKAAPQVTQTVTASLAPQTITFTTNPPPSEPYQGSFTVAATGGGSNNPVTFTSSGACSNVGATYTMTSGTGACLVIANQAGDTNYSAAPQVTQSVNATTLSQAITFTTSAPPSAAYQSSFTVAATGGASGNPVTFTSSGACTNAGATYTMTSGTGTCLVIANQAGDANYMAAPQVTQSVNATTLTQAITFSVNAPGNAAYQSSFTVAATGGASGNPVIFTSSGACTNAGATYAMTSGTGTCSVIANQAGNANYSAAPQVTESVNATPLAQTITFPTIPKQNGPGQVTLTATASSGLTVSYSVLSGPATVSGNILTITAVGSVTVQASQGGNSNYAPATPVSQTVVVGIGPPTDKDQCKDGGWQIFNVPRQFKNQGDCVSFVNNGR